MVIGSRPYSKRFRIIGLPHGFTTAVTACIVLIAASVALLAGCTGVVNTTTTTGNTGTGSGTATAPVITTQPVSQSVGIGQTVNFVVVATGSAPLSYQWQKNGVNISGATSNSYTTPAAATSDNGARFTVVVSNSAGSATSNTATLTVTSTPQNNTAPQIITQPASQTVTAGQSATFTVVASGSPTLTYQWQKNHANITGAAAATYSTPATSTSDGG